MCIIAVILFNTIFIGLALYGLYCDIKYTNNKYPNDKPSRKDKNNITII